MHQILTDERLKISHIGHFYLNKNKLKALWWNNKELRLCHKSHGVFYGSSLKSVLVINLNGNFQPYAGTMLTCPDHINNRKYLSTQATMMGSGPYDSVHYIKFVFIFPPTTTCLCLVRTLWAPRDTRR